MTKFSKIISVLVLLSGFAVHAAELNGVNYDDKLKLGDKELVLNGLGLRKVTKFGFPIKVYVGALYVPKAVTTSDQVLDSTEPKQVSIQFLLSVDRDALNETFGNTYNAQCLVDCANSAKQFVKLRDAVARVNKGDRFVFTSYADKLVFEIVGANAKKVEIADPAVSKNAIAMFLNPKAPPTPELRKGLLGEKP